MGDETRPTAGEVSAALVALDELRMRRQPATRLLAPNDRDEAVAAAATALRALGLDEQANQLVNVCRMRDVLWDVVWAAEEGALDYTVFSRSTWDGPSCHQGCDCVICNVRRAVGFVYELDEEVPDGAV